MPNQDELKNRLSELFSGSDIPKTTGQSESGKSSELGGPQADIQPIATNPVERTGNLDEESQDKQEEPDSSRLLNLRAQQVKLTIQVSQDIAAAQGLQNLYQRVVNEIKEKFGFYHVQLLSFDPHNEVIKLMAGYGEVGKQMLANRYQIPVTQGLIGKAAATGETVLRPDIAKDADWQQNYLLPDTRGEMAIPIKYRDNILGVLDVQSDSANTLGMDEQLLLEGLCGQIAIAIQNQQADEKLNKRVSELNCLSDIGHKIDERPGLSDFLVWVSQRLPTAMQYPDICVAAITLGESTYGKPEAVTLPRKMVGGIRINGQLAGQVHIAYQDEYYFLDEESAFIGAVVGRVSGYIESRQLLDQLQTRSEQLTVLNEMGRMLSTVVDIEPIGETVFKYAAQLMDIPSFFIALYDETNQMLQIPLAYSRGKRVEVPSRRMGNALTDYVIRSGQPLLISDHVQERMAEMGFETRLIGDAKPAESWLGVPIIYGGKVLGAIVTQSTTTPGLYGENECDLLIAVAGQTASIIENSRNFAQFNRQARDQIILNELGQALTQLQEIPQILESAYRFSGQLMDVTNFFVMFYDAERNTINFPLVYFDKLPVEIPPSPLRKGISYQIIFSREPVLFSDHVVEKMQEMGLEFVAVGDDEVPLSWLGVPLTYGEKVFGVISVQSTTTPNMYLEREKDLLVAVASQMAIAIENAHSLQKAKQRTEELAILNELGRALGSAIDLKAIAETVLTYTSKFMDVTNFFFAVNDESQKIVIFPLAVVDKQKIDVPPRPLGNGLSDHIIRHKKPLLLNENVVEQMQELGVDLIALGDGIPPVSWLGVPILYGKQIQGVISVQSVKTPWLYNEAHRDMLTAVANQVAIAIENTNQYQQTQKALTGMAKQAAEMEAVAEVSGVASSIREVEDLLEKVVSLTQKRFNLYHCHVYLANEDTDELSIIACGWEEGSPNEGTHGVKPIAINQDVSLVARATRNHETVIVNDVHSDPGWLPNPFLPDTASEMAVPLLVGERVLGVLDVQSREVNRFSESDVRIQSTLASQIAIAVQNANQYQATQKALLQAEVLYGASDRIVRSTSIQAVLEALVQSTSLNAADRAYVLIFDQIWEATPPSFYKVEAAWERSEEKSPITTGTTLTRKQVAFETYVQRESFTYILDTQTDRQINGDLKADFRRRGVHSLVLFPIIASGEWIGMVSVETSTLFALADSDLRQINNAVGQAATVIESLRLRKDLEERLQDMLTLQRTLARESWTSYLTERGSLDMGYLYDRVGLQAQTLTPAEADYSLPLVIREQEIGRLGVRPDPSNGEMISEDEVAILSSVAEQLSQALERARLLEQTQKSAVELQSVAQVSSATSTILDPTELLQSVVDLAKNSFHLYHAHAYLLDETQTSLVLSAGAGEIGRSMVVEGWAILTDEDTIVTRAAKTRQGQVVNDTRNEPNFLPNPLLPETMSEMAIPMIVGQQLVGVFDVQSTQLNAFSEEDKRTFTTLASQTAVALQNARLFAEQVITVERLRELDHLKSTFLANMSHELRTPLNSILGFAQVILEGIDGPLTDYMISDLQLIEKNGKHLLYLINEILDMSKIESGRLTLSLEPVDLRSLLADVFETTSSQVRERQLYLRLEDDPKADLTISADALRLRQVLLNLTSNAIKFTEAGGVTVKITRRDEMVYMDFVDTGIGIPQDKLEMIFEAFSQVDTSTTRKVGGTGLGLPISRRLIELHGGKLWAESSGSGKGSIFHITLPALANK